MPGRVPGRLDVAAGLAAKAALSSRGKWSYGGGGRVAAIRLRWVIVALMLAHSRLAFAQAGGEGGRLAGDATAIPAQVERIVRFESLAFGQDQPFGGSIEINALIDSNISRAARSDAFGSVIADVRPTLAESARGGIGGSNESRLDRGPGSLAGEGLSLRGQAWVRRPVDNDSDFLVRIAGNGEVYGEARYNDIALSVQAGPEYALGRDRLAFFVGPSWRWFAGEPYSLGLGVGVSWRHPLGRGAQLRIEGAAAKVDNRRDELLDGESYTLSVEYDRALSRVSGVGGQVLLARETAREAGYANTVVGLNLHGFHSLGTTTFVATLGYSRLEADQALFFFPRRRQDDRFAASFAATLGGLRVGPVAPLARLRWERNRSTMDFFDYRRVSGEIGLIAAF
jgi:outer membrane protein